MKKRSELIGTRKLTVSSLRAAVNSAQKLIPPDDGGLTGGHYDPLGAWLFDDIQGEEKWPAVEALCREVERHVILHQQRQVHPLLTRVAGARAARLLAKAWTFIRGE